MHREASRILGAIDGRIEKNTRSGAGIEVTYGQVYDIVGDRASVYIVGSRELAESNGGVAEPSPDFRIPTHLTIATSDYVRVSMDSRGDRWIDESLEPQPDPTVDLSELGEINIGNVSPASLTYAQEVAADSPTDYWRLGESSGTQATNQQNTRHGTYINSPTLGVAGPLADGNTAVTLNGTDEYITVADNAAYDFTGNFSFEVWIKWSGVNGTFGDYIISKGSQVPALWLDTNEFLTLSQTDVGDVVKANTAITDTNWHHVVVTWNGTTGKIYLDGMDVSGSTTSRTFVANSTNLVIGAKYPFGADSPFHGSVDEVAIYNTALTSTRALAHYNARNNTGGGGTWTEKVRVRDNGIIEWSGNSTERDTNLYRASASRLKTEDEFEVGRVSPTDIALIVRRGTDEYASFVAMADGLLQWGSGTAARDTNLYRQSANLLRTDDSLRVDGYVQIGGSLKGFGTSFPTPAASNDVYLRTDLGMWFQYDGTRWQCACPHTQVLREVTGASDTVSATTAKHHQGPIPSFQGGSDIRISGIVTRFTIGSGTALGASHKWVGTFGKNDTTPSDTTIATINIDSGANLTWRVIETTVAADLGGSNFMRWWTTWTKTGTPGNMSVHQEVTYRIVAT